MLVVTLSLSSCVQGDLYDDLYDEDMPSWMMIGRRKFKNDNGDNNSSNGNSSNNYGNNNEDGFGDDFGDESNNQNNNQSDGNDSVSDSGSDSSSGNSSGNGHGHGNGSGNNTWNNNNQNNQTSAERYVNGRSAELRTNWSLEQLESELVSYTKRTTFSANEIEIRLASINAWGDGFNDKGIVEELQAEAYKIVAHKEISGAYFEDDKSGFVYTGPQKLIIYVRRHYSNYVFYRSEYSNNGLPCTSGSFTGTYSHTHPNGDDELSLKDQSFSAGGLKKEAIGVPVDNIQAEVEKLSKVVHIN